MKKAVKKIISNILCVMLLFLNCSILNSAATENVSEQSAVLQSGIYRLKNAGSYKYMTVFPEDCFSGGWVEQKSSIFQSETERSQLFKITYVGTYDGEDCYSIRPMTNSGYVIGCPYPEYTNVAELHSVTSDNYSVLGEANLWYICTDGSYYKLKNKYMGECYYEIYGDDCYIDNAFLCTYDGYDGEIMCLDYMSGEDEAFEQWEIIPYTTDMECIEITNPVTKIPVNSTYDFDAVAYSSVIGRNGPVSFSVINLSGSATINSATGVCNTLSVGEIRVVLTYGDISHSYDITIESAEPDFDSEKEYYFLSIYEGLPDVAYDNEYLYMHYGTSVSADQFGENTTDVKWQIERYLGTDYYTIKNSSAQTTYLTLNSNGEGSGLSLRDASIAPLDSMLWKFIKLADGYYKIQAKLSENTNYFLASVQDPSATTKLVVSEYNSNSNYSYDWKICEVGSGVMLLEIKDFGHDHSTGLAETLPHLDICGYDGFDFTRVRVSSLSDAQSRHSEIKNQIIENMEKCSIFVSRSHGDYDENGTYLRLCAYNTVDDNGNPIIVKLEALHATDIYDYSTQTAKADLGWCDIAVFVGCYTGYDEVYPLHIAAVDAGANYAIGFRDTIICGAANDWTREFFKVYEEYCVQGENIDFAEIASQARDIVDNFEAYRTVVTNLDSYSVAHGNIYR